MSNERKKHGMLRAVISVGLALAVLAGSGLGWTVWRGRLVPSVTTDYAARLNQGWLAVPEEARAEALYLEALRAGSPVPKVLKDPADPDYGEQEAEVGTGPAHADWPVVRAWLEMPEQRRAVALWREGALRTRFGYEFGGPSEERWMRAIAEAGGLPFDPSDLTPALTPPIVMFEQIWHLGQIRRAARMLKSDAFASAERGDFATAGQNIRAMLGTARQLHAEPEIMSNLVGVAVEALAAETSLELAAVHAGSIPAGWRTGLAAELEAHLTQRPATPRTEWNRSVLLDFAQRVYTDDGRGDGVVTTRGLRFLASMGSSNPGLLLGGGGFADRWVPVPDTLLVPAVLGKEGRAAFERALDDVFDAGDRLGFLPAWEIEASDDWAAWDRAEQTDWTRYGPLPADKLLPALRKALLIGMISRAGVEASAFVLRAMEAGPHGPMPTPPADPFDGKPMRASWGADGLVVYSIGTDRDDDGGRPAPRANSWEPAAEAAVLAQRQWANYDGDWVIWPVEVEEEE